MKMNDQKVGTNGLKETTGLANQSWLMFGFGNLDNHGIRSFRPQQAEQILQRLGQWTGSAI